MEIGNVTIVVRGTKGEVKKALFDADGKLIRGDVSILEEKGWSPAGPPPLPLDPDDPSLRLISDPPVAVPLDAPDDDGPLTTDPPIVIEEVSEDVPKDDAAARKVAKAAKAKASKKAKAKAKADKAS